MFPKKISYIILFTLITFSLSLKIPIVDEDFIEVLVGSKPTAMKLLIDPTAPFSYILSDFESTTTHTFSSDYEFKNIYGNFKGNWESDFFYLTSDKVFNLRIKYLKVKTKNSVLNVDGVIGLGFSKQFDEDCSIFQILHKMTDVLSIENLMSYDKKKKMLTIGSLPIGDNYNPVKFPLYEGEKEYPATFVNLTKIRFIEGKEKKDWEINSKAKLGLMPVIVAPKQSIDSVNENFFPNVTTSKIVRKADNEKFFTDVYYDETNKSSVKTEMIFDKIAYKFEHSKKRIKN